MSKYINNYRLKIWEHNSDIDLIIDKQKSNKIKLTITEIDKLLRYISEKAFIEVYDLSNLEDSIRNTCDKVQAVVGSMLEELNIKIYLGDTHKSIGENVIGHYFLIAEFLDINNEQHLYLMDLSYRQFLTKNTLESQEVVIDNIIVKANEPGFYLNQSEEGQMFIKTMIETGFIELNHQTAKLFGDSFYLGRTGPKLDNPLNISGEIYLKSFLKQTGEYSKEYDLYQKQKESEKKR